MTGVIRKKQSAPLTEETAASRLDRVVEVTAPCRLHFGLFSFGRRTGRQYGGVGAMIDAPAVQLRVSHADQLLAHGPLSQRTLEFASRWARFQRLPERLACQITVRTGAPQHVGLGTGTQLGLSVGAALNAFYGLPAPSPPELAISVRRGLRSAVGTYGHALGGLIVERGKGLGEFIAPLDARLDLPPEWRFVLIQPRGRAGLCGPAEQSAFEQLPPVPRTTTEGLMAEVRDRMLPAAAQADFAAFSESVYEYGRLAGHCFSAIQGGPYNGPRLESLVQIVRSLGVSGVGQSSWGPTLFTLLPDQGAAEQFLAHMQDRVSDDEVHYAIAAPNNCGASIHCFKTADEEG